MASIETDKAVVDFDMVEEGYIAKILFEAGTKDIPLGTPVAILVDNEADIAAFADYTPESGESAPAKEAEPVAAAEATPAAVAVAPSTASPAASGDRVVASPLAKKVADESGVNLAGIQGTGPNGRIIEADVQDAMKAVKAAPAKAAKPTAISDMPPSVYQDHDNSNIRKVIAERLTFSK